MVLVQKWPFFRLFFQAIKARKMSFKIFQNEKTPFQAIKTRSSKSGKIHIFPKWLTDGFRQKMPLRLEKCLLRYSKTKRRLSRIIKKRSSKSRKIHIFLKGLTHGFGPKMALFPTFFFRQYRPGKCLLRYSKTKKRLSRL